MTIDALIVHITALTRDAGCHDVITIERRIIGTCERVILNRDLADGSRYVQITPVSHPEVPWEWTMLLSAYKYADAATNLDGRRGGDTTYTLNVIRRWLIELAGWDRLRAFEEGGP